MNKLILVVSMFLFWQAGRNWECGPETRETVAVAGVHDSNADLMKHIVEKVPQRRG